MECEKLVTDRRRFGLTNIEILAVFQTPEQFSKIVRVSYLRGDCKPLLVMASLRIVEAAGRFGRAVQAAKQEVAHDNETRSAFACLTMDRNDFGGILLEVAMHARATRQQKFQGWGIVVHKRIAQHSACILVKIIASFGDKVINLEVPLVPFNKETVYFVG